MSAKIAYVWAGHKKDTPTKDKASLGITGLPWALSQDEFFEVDVFYWEDVAAALHETGTYYDLYVVVLFALGDHAITAIQSVHPNARIVAMPDPPPEHLYYPRNLGDRHETFLEEIWELVNGRGLLATRMYDKRDGSITSVICNQLPRVFLSGPIFLFDVSQHLVGAAKGNYALSMSHSWEPAYGAPNIAALSVVQDDANYKIVYLNGNEAVKLLARGATLSITYEDKISSIEFNERLACANLLIDIYPMHSMGRAAMLAALLGTFAITSTTTQFIGFPQIDPYNCREVASIVGMSQDAAFVDACIFRAREFIEDCYSPAACRRQVRYILDDWDYLVRE